MAEREEGNEEQTPQPMTEMGPPIDQTRKPFWQAVWPVLACGAGLFSDGYVNNVIGSVSTVLTYEYPKTSPHPYSTSNAHHYVSDIAFVGTVIGQLFFGYLADKWSRRNSLLVSTIILIIFTALATASYWHGETIGMFNILVAWRFFVGIGIGGEYPAGSVGCAESTGELKSGTRHMWFIFFTNTMIDWGFVFGCIVPLIVAAACDNTHYSTIWRTSLGIGCVFPIVLFILRLKLKEPEEFSRNSMKYVKIPYWLVLKYYGFRLLLVSCIWFLYDFSSYAFGIYSSNILSSLFDDGAPLTVVFGWNTLVNFFYVPGTMIGAPLSDKLGPRMALIVGVLAQAVIGFIMAGCYEKLSQPHVIAAFCVVFGIFLSFGELGPGNNIGLLAAKTCATGVRGQYYGIAAAVGKVGAFVGTWVFPYIQAAGGGESTTRGNQYPFYVAACLCVLSAGLTYLLPHVDQDTIQKEDLEFRLYLQRNGWDTSQLGLKHLESEESAERGAATHNDSEKKE